MTSSRVAPSYLAGIFGEGSLGSETPAFQFQAVSPLALRLETTSSFNSYIPGNKCSDGRGESVNAM